MKRIIVIGATGLIGSALTKELLRQGHAVTAACRDIVRAKNVLPEVVSCISLNFDSDGWRDSLHQADVVINLSGAPVIGRLTPKHRQAITSSRVGVTKNLVSSIEKISPNLALLINASAIGVYGSHTLTDDIYTEKDVLTPEDYLSHVCHGWEAAAYSPGIQRTVLLRTGVVLDPSTKGTLAKLALPFRLFAGGPIGIKDSWRSWVHIEDEVGLIIYALRNPSLSGPLNVTSPNPVTAAGLSAALGKAMHRPDWLPVPEWAVRVGLGEAAEIITRGKRILPQKAIAAGYTFHYPTIDSALAAAMYPVVH